MELVEGGNDPPAAPACQDCAAVIRNSDIMDCVRELAWPSLDELDIRRVVSVLC